ASAAPTRSPSFVAVAPRTSSRRVSWRPTTAPSRCARSRTEVDDGSQGQDREGDPEALADRREAQDPGDRARAGSASHQPDGGAGRRTGPPRDAGQDFTPRRGGGELTPCPKTENSSSCTTCSRPRGPRRSGSASVAGTAPVVVPRPGAGPRVCWPATPCGPCSRAVRRLSPRSEEHTSELQSRENLVCRLLL